MFFSKFFKKDHNHFLVQARKYLAAERFADARLDFQEALQRCPAGAPEEGEIRSGLDAAANGLGELNLREGEQSLTAGDPAKAFDHFTLAAELAVDPALRSRAASELEKLTQSPRESAAPAAAPSRGGAACSTCQDQGHRSATVLPDDGQQLTDEDRFFLMIQPLPGGLAVRYGELGGEFARAYLLIHDGRDAEALPVLQQMLLSGENDIVIYEVALIMYRAQRFHECETLLTHALGINPVNAASHLALVHLLAETRRIPEAIARVERMMELGVLPDQAQFMLGELHQATGDEERAQQAFTKALDFPGVSRSAAERLVPLLVNQGRSEEAKYLTKRYLKGCC